MPPLIATSKIKKVKTANFIGFGWEKDQVNYDLTDLTGKRTITMPSTNYVDLECGPNNPCPHLKLGSVLLSLPTTNEPTLKRVRLRNTMYSGTFLHDIKNLMFSTYVVTNINESSPGLALQIDTNNDNIAEFYIFFNPTAQNAQNPLYPKVVNNIWQEWDAFNGLWQVFGAPLPGLLNQYFTLTTLASLPNYSTARIINTVAGQSAGGGIRFTIGGGSPDFADFKGYVDAFLIETPADPKPICYDFVCHKSEIEEDDD